MKTSTPDTTDRTIPAYPFAIVRTDRGYSAGGLQFASVATAETRDELLRLLREQVALHLLDCRDEGRQPDAPKPPDALDLSDYRAEGIDPEIVYLEAAEINEVSVEIERVLREEGLSHADLARRMNVSRSVVTRITDPLYFGHTSRTLRNVAEALGRELRIELIRTPAR